MVDMIVVGNFVGTEGLSAVAIGGEVLMLITFVAMGSRYHSNCAPLHTTLRTLSCPMPLRSSHGRRLLGNSVRISGSEAMG